MDVKHLKSILLLFAWFGLVACENTDPAQTVISNTAPECQATAIESRYLVKWKDGTITVEEGSSREKFIDEFIRPNIDTIAKVEQDQLIPANPTFKSIATKSQKLVNSDLWGIDDVDAEKAWKITKGENSVVAVVDSGVDREHPFLKNQLALNDGERGQDSNGHDKRYNGRDDDGNGYVDDYAGYNFATNDAKVKDESGHGTHVAGIVAAEHTDSTSVVPLGIAPKAKILPVDFMSDERGGLTSDAILGLRYAQKMGVTVINASWGGGPCSDLLREAISDLRNDDILFVNASGNRGNNIDYIREYPGSYNLMNQITVGMVTRYKGMDRSSNYGAESVHLFAPGREILSTLPNSQIGFSTGTSMASPFVAGAVALLKSYRPQATGGQIKEAIMDSTTKDRGYLNSSGGRLHLSRALETLAQRVEP